MKEDWQEQKWKTISSLAWRKVSSRRQPEPGWQINNSLGQVRLMIILLPTVIMTGLWRSPRSSRRIPPLSSPTARPRSPPCQSAGAPAAAWGRSRPRPPGPSRQTSSGGQQATCRQTVSVVILHAGRGLSSALGWNNKTELEKLTFIGPRYDNIKDNAAKSGE